jgi:hypothetical protein
VENRNIAIQLERARVILTAATTNEELKQRLAGCGYTEAEVQGGMVIYQHCLQLRAATHDARFAKTTSTKATLQMREQLDEHYATLARVGRTLFLKQPAVQERLGLIQRRRTVTTEANAEQSPESGAQTTSRQVRTRSKAQASVLDRTRTLYDGIIHNPSLLQEFENVGYSAERLRQERSYLEALESTDVQQEMYKAASKARTAEQRAAIEELGEWIARFSGIVGAALADRPDLLVYMGLKPRGRRAQA